MFQIKPAQAVLSTSVAAAWIALFAALASPNALSAVQDCKMVSAGLAEAVDFAVPSKSGDMVQVQGVLRKPAGDRTFAALIVLHGSGGVRPPRCYAGAIDLFTSWGYVTLLVDSPSQSDLQVGLGGYSFADQARHARGAAAFLASLPYVDRDRIGVVGWSKGGFATIVTITSPKPQASGGPQIRAAAAVYPICPRNTRRLYAPLLVLIGESDTMVSVSACRDLSQAVVTNNMQLVTYPNAAHVFDAPWSSAYRHADSEDAYERLRLHLETYLSAEQR